MDDEVGTFFIGLIFGVVFTILFIHASHSSYMDGQIDALTGDIKYELITNEDQTMSWEVIN